MPTVDYLYLDVFPDHSEINHEICVISEDEWNRRENRSHMWESDGRMARREISVFDQMMAELSAEKQNRRDKFMRKDKSRRKAKMQSLRYRNRSGISEEKIPDNCHFRGHDSDRGYWRNWKAFCEMKSIPEWKAEDRERSLRKDWIGEQKDIDAEIYDAECLKEQIADAKQCMSHTVQRIDCRINQYAEIVGKLLELECPTDWESLDAYRNAVDTAVWYVFD